MENFQDFFSSGQATEMAMTWGLRFAQALIIFFIGRLIARLIARGAERLMGKAGVDKTLSHFLYNVMFTVMLVAVIVAAIKPLGVDTTSFIAILGAAGLAIGLALQGSLSNFSSGIMLILFRPFEAGDFVEAGGATGMVEQINIFNTVMKTGDNREIIVPNSKIFDDIITNYSARDMRRIDLLIGIGYSDDIRQARQVIENVMQKDERVLDNPESVILVMELGASSVDLAVRPWVKTADYWTTRSDLLENIKVELEAAGCNIPYPQQDVHLHQVTA